MFDDYNFSKSIIDSINKWLVYKKEKRQTYKETGLKTLLNKIQKDIKENGEQYIVDSIDFSITNNYSGIYAPNTKKHEKQQLCESTFDTDEFFELAIQRGMRK
jgi:hypothetical protein